MGWYLTLQLFDVAESRSLKTDSFGGLPLLLKPLSLSTTTATLPGGNARRLVNQRPGSIHCHLDIVLCGANPI